MITFWDYRTTFLKYYKPFEIHIQTTLGSWNQRLLLISLPTAIISVMIVYSATIAVLDASSYEKYIYINLTGTIWLNIKPLHVVYHVLL